MSASFLPTLPFQLSYPLLFGVLLVAGMLGGEIARALRLPRMIGYAVVGFVFGPLAGAMGMAPLIDEARIFVDLAMGSALRLGAWTSSGASRLPLTSRPARQSLLPYRRVRDLDRSTPPRARGLAARSRYHTPAVVCSPCTTPTRWQVTERALRLCALNGLARLGLVTIMLGSAHYEWHVDRNAVLHPSTSSPARSSSGSWRGPLA